MERNPAKISRKNQLTLATTRQPVTRIGNTAIELIWSQWSSAGLDSPQNAIYFAFLLHSVRSTAITVKQAHPRWRETKINNHPWPSSEMTQNYLKEQTLIAFFLMTTNEDLLVSQLLKRRTTLAASMPIPVDCKKKNCLTLHAFVNVSNDAKLSGVRADAARRHSCLRSFPAALRTPRSSGRL